MKNIKNVLKYDINYQQCGLAREQFVVNGANTTYAHHHSRPIFVMVHACIKNVHCTSVRKPA